MGSGVDGLVSLFDAHGAIEYKGTGVSQLEHALQAAEWAATCGESPPGIMAALCHNVGHLLGLAGHDLSGVDWLGGHRHAVAGADWLERELGLGKDVTDLVRLQMAAIRYQARRVSGYAQDVLNAVEREALELEDGAMDLAEAEQFEAHPRYMAVLRVRAYDCAGRVRGQRTWGLEEALEAAGHSVTTPSSDRE